MMLQKRNLAIALRCGADVGIGMFGFGIASGFGAVKKGIKFTVPNCSHL